MARKSNLLQKLKRTACSHYCSHPELMWKAIERIEYQAKQIKELRNDQNK